MYYRPLAEQTDSWLVVLQLHQTVSCNPACLPVNQTELGREEDRGGDMTTYYNYINCIAAELEVAVIVHSQ